MNRPIRIATSFRSRAHSIRRDGQDFIALHQDGTMQFCLVRLVVGTERLPYRFDLFG